MDIYILYHSLLRLSLWGDKSFPPSPPVFDRGEKPSRQFLMAIFSAPIPDRMQDDHFQTGSTALGDWGLRIEGMMAFILGVVFDFVHMESIYSSVVPLHIKSSLVDENSHIGKYPDCSQTVL